MMMKDFLVFIICSCFLVLIIYNINPITDEIVNMTQNEQKLVIKKANSYAKNQNYKFVQKTNDFTPYSFQDILNIYYSTLDNGWHEFTFYCPNEYANCLNDIEKISRDELILTHLNNYVHPFNNFINIKSAIKNNEITLTIEYIYNEEEISKINNMVNDLISRLPLQDKNDYEKIKIIHDYIINNVRYDTNYNRNENSGKNNNSSKATGPLFYHLATCNGYTDLMAIFLTKLGFNNYKIATTPDEISYSSTGHVWNAVKIDNQWRHLDLTWDDPISNDGKDNLYHRYFLVTTAEMLEADKGNTTIEEHNFNKLYYLEFN